MNKLTMLGLGLLILSGLLLGFQAINSMMTAGQITWKEMTILSAAGEEYFRWVDGMTLSSIKSAILYVIKLPLYIVLAAVGLTLLIIGGLTSK